MSDRECSPSQTYHKEDIPGRIKSDAQDRGETSEKSWPGGFHDTITKKMITMTDNRKHIKVGEVKVFDTATIYSRAMGLQSGQRLFFSGSTPG